MLRLLEREAVLSAGTYDLETLSRTLDSSLASNERPVRFTVTNSTNRAYECEVGVLSGAIPYLMSPLFEFKRRSDESSSDFNAVLIVPTGIGAEIGGHSGDATPAAILLSEVSDSLITHPNVVNASDINELPPNGLYVEGSVLARLLMGTVGLQSVRSNKVLVVLDSSYKTRYARYTVNAVNAARASYGLRCAGILDVETPLRVVSGYTSAGRASGTVDGLDGLLGSLTDLRETYDSVAICTVVEVPDHYHMDYFTSGGEIINPWGGVEALLTHAVSSILDVPTAHAPMMESDEVASVDPGIVDSRMAAEIISMTFLQSVLKGLQRAPRIVTGDAEMSRPDVLTAEDVDCVVIPDGCLGLPTLAALHQDIPVIAVKENRNLMRNDLTMLPWGPGQFYIAENYWEAAGIVAALKAGIDPGSVRRPLKTMRAQTDG